MDVDSSERGPVAEATEPAEIDPILATAREALGVLDAELRVVRANRAFFRAFRVTPAEAVGRSIFELCAGPADAPSLRAQLEGVLRRGDTLEDVRVDHDAGPGGRGPLLLSARRLREHANDRIVVAVADATEQPSDEARAWLAAVVDSSNDPIISKTLDGVVTSWNPAAERLLGYTAAEAVGRHITLIVPPERRAEEEDVLARLRRGETIDHFETVRVTRDGRRVSVSLTVSPVKNAAGRIIGASKVMRDIGEQRKAEAVQRHFRSLFEAAPGLYLVLSPEAYEIVAASDAYLRATMTEREAIVGRRLFDVFPDDPARPDADGVQNLSASLERVKRNGRTDVMAVQLYPVRRPASAGGGFEERWWSPINSPVFGPDGELTYIIHRVEDVTPFIRSKQAEGALAEGMQLLETRAQQMEADIVLRAHDLQRANQRLRESEAALQDADRRKNEFLAMLAHELRNPLAPLRNALHVMALTEPGARAHRSALAMMERQVDHMVRLVDDLLDVSRITRGKIQLRKERVDLVATVGHAVEAARSHCDALEQSLRITLTPRPVYVHADPTRLIQIVGNLLNNASKFSPRGAQLELRVEVEDSGRFAPGAAVLRVRDQGIGIAPDQLPRIFDLFVQVETSMGRSAGGLGMGLALVKELVELHAGTVEARSEGIGRGSEFTVRLPIASDAHVLRPGPIAGEAPPRAARRILVVDDNRDSAESLAALLQLHGSETRTAHDGLEALEMAATFRPDVVLLDIGLPSLSGHETARRMRKQPWGQEIILVAVTGWGQDEDRRRSEDAGFDAHLVKPVDRDALFELLSELELARQKSGWSPSGA